MFVFFIIIKSGGEKYTLREIVYNESSTFLNTKTR